jgi:hypothetical protein
MPILSPAPPAAPVFYPKENYSIAKYMDITKFVSLLFKESLFFCRVDKLEDKFEGTSYKTNYEDRIREVKQMQDSGRLLTNWTDEEIVKDIKTEEEFEEKQKALHCIDCWNISTGESAALWKIYSDFSKGIMIQSSVSNLENAFAESKECIGITEVKYQLYKTTKLPYGNSNHPFLFKQKAYNYENEIRLIYSLAEKSDSEWKYDWSKEEVEQGLYIKVDLVKLIDKIVLSPYSPKWFYELINDITKKYCLNKPIEKSEFSFY